MNKCILSSLFLDIKKKISNIIKSKNKNMPWSSQHIKWFKEIKSTLQTNDGKDVTLLEFNHDLSDIDTMKKWAKHFRNHYCFDSEIDFFRGGTGFSRKEYLENLKFPTDARGFGPGIRSGDFCEILIADYLEYIMKYWVPRTRYGNKVIRDESTKGSDLIGFSIYDENETSKDILTMVEVKGQFSGTACKPRLQDAISDSVKDEIRKAESLNAIKQRLFDKGQLDSANKIARFQNPVDKPYTSKYGAAALFSNNIYSDDVITSSITNSHPFKSDLFLIVVKGEDLNILVNELYTIAANES